jgi:membrane protein YqaA with SNARE-associated domain
VTALGLLLFGASIFIIIQSGVPDFPMSAAEAQSAILYSTISGIISAVLGVVIQYFVNKKMTELRKQEIIEVM